MPSPGNALQAGRRTAGGPFLPSAGRTARALSLFLLTAAHFAPGLYAGDGPGRAYPQRDGSSLNYSRPGLWRNIGAAPADWGLFVRNSFKKESLPWLGAVAVTTLVLIDHDQKLYAGAKKAGRKLRISSEDKTRTYLKLGGVSLFRGPGDLGSALYFLGDGWMPLGLFAGFEARGLLKDDWRAAQTGHQLAEGLLAAGFTTQVIKRVTGRETPRAASAPGGVWRMFPSFREFQSHRTRYDAVPSGHMATGMMTITVLSANYPDNSWLKPVGYSLLAGLGFQMINNGVHWASDYPLGLAVGYGLGRAIATGGRTSARREPAAGPAALRLTPGITPSGATGLKLSYNF